MKANGIADTEDEEKYPAFYYAKNYGINNGFTGDMLSGWYLPSSAEIYSIYSCIHDSTNGIDIDSISELLGGDKFGSDSYKTSSDYCDYTNLADIMRFSIGLIQTVVKTTTGPDNGCTCAIREF